MVKVHVVDLKTETIASPISVRAYLNQSITEFKQLIAQVTRFSQFFHWMSSSFLNFMNYVHELWEREIILANLERISSQATGLSAENMRVVLERCYNDLRLLYVPNKTLKAEGFFRSNKVPTFSFHSDNFASRCFRCNTMSGNLLEHF